MRVSNIGKIMEDKQKNLKGKVKCLGIKLYVKLHGIVDSKSDIIEGSWELNRRIHELFGKNEQLKKLGFLSCNGQVEYQVIDENTRYEYIMCPMCLSTNVDENRVPTTGEPSDYEQFMRCNECGYEWDDDGEYK